jgi:hypothetical protein
MEFDHKEVWERLPIAPERREELYRKALKFQLESKAHEIERECCRETSSEVDAATVESKKQKNARCSDACVLPKSRTSSDDDEQ